MKVLVLAASRHGSTTEIARAVGARLRERGHDVDVVGATTAVALDGYDAVVLGSALYAGRWVKAARDLAETSERLRARPLWLFSSGPLDGAPQDAMSRAEIDHLVSVTGAVGHQVFAGRLDHTALGPVERLVAKVVRAPDGDFRDWGAVDRWSDGIADALVAAR